jgi:nitroreductase
MRWLKGLWYRILYAMRVLRSSLSWNMHHLRHRLLCQEPPQDLDGRLLASFVRWHAHQTEKATKHVSAEDESHRGLRHFRDLVRYLDELKRRSLPEYRELVRWAERIASEYQRWSTIPGWISRTVPDGTARARARPSPDQLAALMRHRTSTRMWRPKTVPPNIVRTLIEAAIESPSSCSRMGWYFVGVCQTPPKERVLAANNSAMLRNAPVIIYLAAYNDFYPERFAPALDLGGAGLSILLMAEAYGLRGCPIYHAESFDQAKLRRDLSLPRSAYVYMAICLGYPDDVPCKPIRSPAHEFYRIVER